MQRVQKEVEIAQWFSRTLMDPSVTRLDDLKSGAHLVQLVHSMNPGAFDLSRCDFLASTAYHYEKNFKLLQSVLPPSMMPQHFAIERLMEGEKQRDLFNFCAFVRTHYKAWASQLAATGGALPTHNTYVGDSVSVVLPGRMSGGEPGSVLAAIEDVRTAQENYDPVQERARAKEKRKFRSRPPLSNSARRAMAMLESNSMRSSSDATSVGVRSAFSMVQIASHALQRQGGGAPPSNVVAGPSRGVEQVVPPQSLVENWARSVQTPTGGTSPISDDHSSPRESSVETGAAAAVAAATADAASTAAVARPASANRDEPVEAGPARVDPTTPTAAPPPPLVATKPTVSMQYFPVLRSLQVWDLVDDTARFLDAMTDLHLSVIVDVDGEGMESSSIISFEELMLRKYGRPAAVASTAPLHASRGDGLPAPSVHTALSEESSVAPAPIVSDAWDEFDELMLRAG